VRAKHKSRGSLIYLFSRTSQSRHSPPERCTHQFLGSCPAVLVAFKVRSFLAFLAVSKRLGLDILQFKTKILIFPAFHVGTCHAKRDCVYYIIVQTYGLRLYAQLYWLNMNNTRIGPKLSFLHGGERLHCLIETHISHLSLRISSFKISRII